LIKEFGGTINRNLKKLQGTKTYLTIFFAKKNRKQAFLVVHLFIRKDTTWPTSPSRIDSSSNFEVLLTPPLISKYYE